MAQGKKAVLAQRRVYRTIDGRFVGEGDPEGAFLAYGVGAEVPVGDQPKYFEFMENRPEDVVGTTTGDKAYDDEDVRDALRRQVAGDPNARSLNTPPVLLHDRLHTELADEAAAIANATDQGAVAEMRSEAPGLPEPVLATHAIYRTAEGDLVHEGDPDAAELAYPVGAPVADADVDEYHDLGAPDGDDPEPEGATKPPAGAKRAGTSANKAARKPADK